MFYISILITSLLVIMLLSLTFFRAERILVVQKTRYDKLFNVLAISAICSVGISSWLGANKLPNNEANIAALHHSGPTALPLNAH